MSRHGSQEQGSPREAIEHTVDKELELSGSKHDTNQKLIEAKTAVILLKNSRLCTKNEYTQWLLKILYQPCSRVDEDGKNVLYLSRSRRKIWATDFSIKQDPTQNKVNYKDKDQLYVITPKTTIMTLTQENRLVYIIDLSSSLATVGNTRSDILLSEVFQTLKNSLEGLVQPFSMQVSPTEKAVVQTMLRLTVLADCSQFASNINVIPMLVEHPTMHVFMQNVNINANNIHTIIKKLRSEFLNFQEETAQFRKAMKKNRPNMGYNLDVGNEVTATVLDATSLPNKTTEQPPLKPSTSDFDLFQRSKETAYHSSKKEVWGIGKSGANLSRILHAGHFALKLMPRQGRAQLILITDGAMKSNVHDNTFVRQFAEEDITCHVIQIGFASSFIPGRNFGFVPDTEILQFLARATCGTFMYSEKCLTKVNANLFTTLEESTPDSNKTYPIIQFVDLNKATHIKTPNIFHRQFLFRETVLTRYHHTESLLQAEKDSGIPHRREDNNDLGVRYNFPWDPYAKPPEGDWRLLKYREYTLPAEFSHIIAARAREGFTVQSVTFDDGTGSKHVDSGLNDLEVPDFAAVRKERIQIVMMMRWQPNVSIEYRIRATWLPTVIGKSNAWKNEDLLMSSGIFNRGKAPRAEIFVRTDASFAHMLQNWDMFRRRAQMMGVVTGSSGFGEKYASPVYSKIEKLKAYLIDIFEGDEVLKTVISFPNKFWINVSSSTSTTHSTESNPGSNASSFRPESNRMGLVQQKLQFIDSFAEFWNRMNHAETRARTRCWYDPGCIDLLVGDVSPYMTPKLSSTYNQDFVFNVEEDIFIMMENVKNVMSEWADFKAKDGTFVKMMHRIVTTPALDDQIKDYFTASLGYPPSFCELRVRHEYGRLVTLRLLFFNVDVLVRKRATEHLIHLIHTTDETKASCNMICERPFSRLLMRDPKHFSTESQPGSPRGMISNLAQHQSRAKAWYLPVAMWLTSEYIVRDYLRHMTWSWQTDNYQDAYHRENKMMPIHDLAFQFLCQARLDQGYQLVSPRPDSTQFYQELALPSSDGKSTSHCAIQYFAWKDSETGKITTELWMEPSGSFDVDQYDLVKQWTFEPDKKTISQLVTFDQMHAVGRSKGAGDFKRKGSSETTSDGTTSMMLPQLFDVASVLRSNKFVIASYKAPQYKRVSLPPKTPLIRLRTPAFPYAHLDDQSLQGEQVTPVMKGKVPHIKAHRYLRRHIVASSIETEHSVPNSPDLTDIPKLFNFRPDALLNKNKESIAKLEPILQNYALLHYFVERALHHISHGEILMSHHDIGAAFWQDLKDALQSVTQEGKVSSTGLIPDLRKTRCFVKVFDPRSFVVILFPSLDSVCSGLMKLQEDHNASGISTVEKCKYVDAFMFECVRQKPIRPTKLDGLIPGASFIDSVIQDGGKITIKKVDHLIHTSDGLGTMLRPELFEGEYSTCQSHAQLTDRVLRVAQDVTRFYCKSFLKSFYTCLMKGFIVDDQDLAKVLEVCQESSMEIDITEFIHTMMMQRQESDYAHVQEVEIQGKFENIIHQYFDAVKTKNEAPTNLYYYKPPFTRIENYNTVQDAMSLDEKIAYIIDLVAHSQDPLLIRLNAVYKTTDTSGEVPSVVSTTMPVTWLPTSFPGQTAENTTPTLVDELFPGSDGNTKAYLQIVCLSMPRSTLDDYPLNEQLLSSTSESLIQSMQSQPECFSTLNHDQQSCLAETDSRLDWLLKEETMHGLLKSPTITLSTLQHIENILSRSNPYLDYPTCITMPFQFVKNWSESRLIFMKEMEKDCQHNTKYTLKRVGDYFYVSQDATFRMGDEQAYSNSASPVVSEGPPTMDYCDGLGIIMSDSPEDEESEDQEPEPIEKRPLYWLILIPHERYVQIYFYSKLNLVHATVDILNPVKEKIKVMEERTNRLSLLNYLQETRMCSKYLEIPNTTAVYSDQDESGEETITDERPVENTCRFIPGQFACPVVFTKRFPLHWRLQPNVALKYLSTDVLRLFTIMNRPDMYVIERDESIVYCKIYEETMDEEVEGSPNTVYGSPVLTFSGGKEEDTQTLVGFESTPRKLNSITSPRPRGTNNSRPTSTEKRELVLEVYGIDLPSWVENEFVNMIENRLVSQITLNEIQQFLSRNSTSKPTAADVEFILPAQKPPTHREMLRVPSLVRSPYTLLNYFKQSLLADNIRPLTGPYVREVVERYYDNVFFTQETDAIQDGGKREFKSRCETTQTIAPGAFCFYYNCTKRILGTSSALELLAGQGIAGICLTLLDETGVPITAVTEDGKCGANFDPEVIHDCLEEEFREAPTGTTYHHIWVDMWTTGTVDGNALMQHIYECYRCSLCDYFIEKTVTIDLGAALSIDGALQRAVHAKAEGRLGTTLRKKFIETVLYILKKASDLKSPTVCAMDAAIQTTPWCMDDLIRYMDMELRKIDASLRPTVAWTPLPEDVWGESVPKPDSKWELYRGFQYRQRQKLQSNIRLVAISGLDEFVEKLGSVSNGGGFGNERRQSATSEPRSRRSSGDSMTTDNSQKRSRADSRSSSVLSNTQKNHSPHMDAKKHCFMIMTLDVNRLSIYTYNWSEAVSHDLFNGVLRVANRQEARNEIMTNILHQKMGLFHHTEPMKRTMEKFGSLSLQNAKSLSAQFTSGSATIPATPLIHLTSPNNGGKKSRPYENKADTTQRRPTTTPLFNAASMLNLKDMLTFPTTTPLRNFSESDVDSKALDQENSFDRILQKSPIKNAELDHALMDSITESVAETIRSRDFDILRRHGQPFLEAFLRRAKLQSAHRKALKVYLKWRKRYGDPESETDLAERLSKPEVSTIMRSSRVLHFCRTPLIFCDPEKEWPHLQEGSAGQTAITQWFETMGTTLMAEYANYLEGADMQRIDFAKSEDHGDNTLRSSRFNVGKKWTAECSPTYLLRVFEGGSIICEVRLTSVFVSVTLYTLHRQYGRLNYNRFRRENRIKKRSNFKKFEENSGHFKQMIHINSFVYDFQLHYIQTMLQDPRKLSVDLDVLGFVRRFARVSQPPSPYSKDRIVHGFYQCTMDDVDQKSFFENLFKNAPRHGLLNIANTKGYSAATVTSTHISFKQDQQAQSNWKYTLMLCSPTEIDKAKDETVMIEYFVLIVYQAHVSPETITKRSWIKGDKSTKRLDQVSLPEEGLTLAEIVSGARTRIDTIVSEVLVRSKRARDWSKLYSADLGVKKSKHSTEERQLVHLMSEFDRVDITDADQDMAKIFQVQHLNWHAALDTVKAIMKTSSRDFNEGGCRHLLLYNARYMDYMIHLEIDQSQKIRGWMVSREDRLNKCHFEGAETEQMISLAKNFYYYMWRVASDKRLAV